MIKAAVLTGAHPYDVTEFQEFVRNLDSIEAYVQNLEDFVMDPARAADSYDVLVFYNFHQVTPPEPVSRPADRRNPWTDHAQDALIDATQSAPGILILHHALLAWPEWDYWSRLVGITDRTFGFHKGQTVTARVQSQHPLTEGLEDWDLVDETYTMSEPEVSEPLITYDHPLSMRAIAWAHEVDGKQIVCYQAGHDQEAFRDRSFRRFVGNAIRWLGHPS